MEEKHVTKRKENMDFLLTLETSGIQIMSFKKLGLMNLYPPKK